MKQVNISLAAFAGLGHHEAMQCAVRGASEPALGVLGVSQTQLCPQNSGQVTEALCHELRASYPGTRFRLHANVQVLSTRSILDLSRWHERRPYWEQLARISKALDAPAYSAHAGRRSEASLSAVLDAVRACEDLMGVPTAVEGHYPTAAGDFHIATWSEYRHVMESGVRYVVDVSHLHICATRERRFDLELLKALVADDRCIEVHLSGNNGRRDEHLPLQAQPWWWPALEAINDTATVFSEGAQLAQGRRH